MNSRPEIRKSATNGLTRQTPLTCTGHTRPVVDLDFSGAAQDGYFLLSACKDGKPMLRQGETGDWVGTFINHKGAVWGVSLNDQATKACTGSADFTARVWDCVSGAELAQFPHEHIVRSVTFSKSNGASSVATGCQDKLVRIFDLNVASTDNSVPQHTLSGHASTIKKIIWQDADTIITASDDKTLRKWDLRSPKCVHTRTFDSPVSDLSISKTPNGDIITAVVHSNVIFFNNIAEMPIKQYTLPTKLNTACLHNDLKTFVAGGEDLKMYKYDYETGEELEAHKGHFGPIHIVRFSPDGELYASGSEDGTIRLWQSTPGKAYGLWKGKEQGDNAS